MLSAVQERVGERWDGRRRPRVAALDGEVDEPRFLTSLDEIFERQEAARLERTGVPQQRTP